MFGKRFILPFTEQLDKKGVTCIDYGENGAISLKDYLEASIISNTPLIVIFWKQPLLFRRTQNAPSVVSFVGYDQVQTVRNKLSYALSRLR